MDTTPRIAQRRSEGTHRIEVNTEDDQVQSRVINDKYNFSDISDQIDCLDNHSRFFEFQEKQHSSNKSVKGRLKDNIEYWRDIGTNDYILSIIDKGYVIPFAVTPNCSFNQNNKSAIQYSSFVTEAINDLVDKGCVIEVPFVPFVVNPLSVALNSSGKKRLILDLRVVNEHLVHEKIKFEDWRTAIQIFSKHCFMFKFDISSAYHHIEISPTQQTFLGFSWEGRYYCFSVLPFGLATAPYVFTKVVRALVKHWRRNASDIVVYLDDGWGCGFNFSECQKRSEFVKLSLEQSGFIVNEQKSIWTPTLCLEWLGLIWNASDFTLSIPDRRIDNVFQVLQNAILKFPVITAREIAKVTGKIISLSPVLGNVCRLMTRYLHLVIIHRVSWDKRIKLDRDHPCITELQFWLHNVHKLNLKRLTKYDVPATFIYSDASSLAGAAYLLKICNSAFHYSWSSIESLNSSTWRELKAIELAFKCYCSSLKGKTVKWFTDSQNCVKIIECGSMKRELQAMAYSIFETCLLNNIRLEVQWIPRTINEQADYLSKLIDFDDWGVSREFFEFVDSLWGVHTIDRFADCHNTKLDRFNSRYWSPGSENVDCFSQNWFSENNWIVPPINLVVKSIKHLVACKAIGTLIVPNWRSSIFWTMIFGECNVYKPYVVDVLEFNESERIFVQGRNKDTLFGSDKFKGTVLAVRINANL